MKSDETYPTMRHGLGGEGGGKTVAGNQVERSVETEMRRALRWEIWRICFEDSGVVKV